MARTSASDPLEKYRFAVYALSTANQDTETEIVNKDGKDVITAITLTGTALGGFTTVQLPKITTNKMTYREGDNLINVSALSPGLSSTEDIVLTKGLIAGPVTTGTGDTTTTTFSYTYFYQWASSIHGGGDTTSDFNYKDSQDKSGIKENTFDRRHLRIVMKDRTGNWARVWDIFNAFPVQFTPGSDLDAMGDDAKSIESLTIAYESFVEREVNADKTGVV